MILHPNIDRRTAPPTMKGTGKPWSLGELSQTFIGAFSLETKSVLSQSRRYRIVVCW